MSKKAIAIFVTTLLFSFYADIYCQIDDERPESPVLQFITIDNQARVIRLLWQPSASPDVDRYVIYNLFDNSWIADNDTILSPSTNQHQLAGNYYIGATEYFSQNFVIAALDTADNISPLSNQLKTIFVNGSLDSCSSAIRLSWNAYLSVPYAVNSYDVYENVSGSTWRNIATTTDTILTIRQFESDVVYRYKIIANLEGGLQSESNIASVDTKMQRPPSWINADYATVNNSNKIELSFTFDQESEIYNFSLERKDIDGAYAQIASIESRNGHIEYEDFVAQTNKEYLYRIAAINLCGNAAIYSNEASNIVLRQETDENLVTLTWNRYRNWDGGIEEQILQIDFGDGYRDYMMISGVDSSITINYSDIIEEINSSMIGVRIKAIEGVNSHVTSGESYSQRLSLTPKEEITVPNVFTPDGNLINDFFYPVLSFVPTQYQLIICDLNRKKVFETTDYKAQWDGTYNGTRLPEGVYLWFLNVTTPSGKKISDTGTITIVKND